MHVLIIEGQRGVASSMLKYLETKGHVVDTAGCEISFRNLALVAQYDAIILGAMTPDTDGLALCRELRSEGCNATPILMICGMDSLDDKIACLEAGADDCLTKYATHTEVESRLRVLFRLRPRSNANFRSNRD
jgi:DNA-binding response OmpR family regulator